MSEIARKYIVIENIVRQEWGHVLSALIVQLQDFELSEMSLQDAFMEALAAWTKSGIPDTPAAWLFNTAKSKANDRVRRAHAVLQKQGIATVSGFEQLHLENGFDDINDKFPDARLMLFFICGHPILSDTARIALTLKSVAGMSTSEISRAFLVSKETIADRLTRARQKLTAENIPYSVPEKDEMEVQLQSVLSSIYLIFNEGYSATHNETSYRKNLCTLAVQLTEDLLELMDDEREVRGLLALLLLHSSRHQARRSINGKLITLEKQDRTLWDRELIKEGLSILIITLTGSKKGKMGAFQIQAAICAAHTAAATYEQTNWREISGLYEKLYKYRPTPVVMLNGAVALSFAHGPLAGLAAIEQIELEGNLTRYQPFFAAKADMLARAGRIKEALPNYRRAVELSSDHTERHYLRERLERLASKLE